MSQMSGFGGTLGLTLVGGLIPPLNHALGAGTWGNEGGR